MSPPKCLEFSVAAASKAEIRRGHSWRGLNVPVHCLAASAAMSGELVVFDAEFGQLAFQVPPAQCGDVAKKWAKPSGPLETLGAPLTPETCGTVRNTNRDASRR